MSTENQDIKPDSHTLFYHTKPDFDPLNRRKRLTICMLIVDDQVKFGYSRGHTLDVRKWNRKEGRNRSYDKAINDPILVMDLPDEKPKVAIIDKAKEIARALILMDVHNKPLTKEAALEKLAKRRRQLERLQDDLDGLFIILIETTTKVHEFFYPEVKTEFDKSKAHVGLI